MANGAARRPYLFQAQEKKPALISQTWKLSPQRKTSMNLRLLP
jgi:hypothetical protein